MKLAAQMFTVRDYTGSEKEVAETVRRLKKIGYDAVQISGLQYYDPKSLHAVLEDNDMTVCVTHTPLARILEETDTVIEEHRLLGAKYIGIGWFPLPQSIDGYAKLIDDCAAATEKMAAAGMRLLYHNHEIEFVRLNGVRGIDYLRDHTSPDRWGFIADMYWVQFAGESPTRFLKTFAGRVPVIHLKDMRANARDSSATRICEIGEGNIDFEAICETCRQTGVEWAAVEQDKCDGDPFESLAISYRYIKNTLKL